MRVRDLIDSLKEMDQDATVHFAYNYGDHWHTQVAPEIEEVNEGRVVHSNYHNMPRVVELYDEDGEDVPEADSASNVVILS